MSVAVVRSEWSGLTGGPGLTQHAVFAGGGSSLSSANAQSAVNAVRAFWAAIAGLLPTGISIQVAPALDEYDEITATLVGSVTAATPPTAVTGSGSGTYAAGAGAKIDWNTGVVLGGRRVVGHTYVVPMIGSGYESNGTLSGGAITSLTNAASGLLTSLSTGGLGLAVWTRPGGISSVPGITGVSSASVRDKTAFLRGRRD